MSNQITQNASNFANFVLLGFATFTFNNETMAQSAGFTMPSSAYINTPVQMINSSPSSFTSHQWDIDDNGSTEYTTTDATHTFTTVGVKCVRLSSQNSTLRDSVLKCINITKPTGTVNTSLSKEMVNLFPNPSSGIVNISQNGLCSENMDVKIYNATGSLVNSIHPLENRNGIQTVDLSLEADGLYFIHMIIDGIKIKKIISIHR